jgi:hypothetical protein
LLLKFHVIFFYWFLCIGICFRGIFGAAYVICNTVMLFNTKLRIRIPCSAKSTHFHAVNNLGFNSINLKLDVLDYTITILGWMTSTVNLRLDVWNRKPCDILLLQSLLLYSAIFFLIPAVHAKIYMCILKPIMVFFRNASFL